MLLSMVVIKYCRIKKIHIYCFFVKLLVVLINSKRGFYLIYDNKSLDVFSNNFFFIFNGKGTK